MTHWTSQEQYLLRASAPSLCLLIHWFFLLLLDKGLYSVPTPAQHLIYFLSSEHLANISLEHLVNTSFNLIIFSCFLFPGFWPVYPCEELSLHLVAARKPLVGNLSETQAFSHPIMHPTKLPRSVHRRTTITSNKLPKLSSEQIYINHSCLVSQVTFNNKNN